MQPFAQSAPPLIVTRPLGPIGYQYQIRTDTGAPQPIYVPNLEPVFRYGAVTRQLPWTPQSYPFVGREPHMFPPRDVPAIPATHAQASHRKRQLGRVVSSGTPTSPPGLVTTTSTPGG